MMAEALREGEEEEEEGQRRDLRDRSQAAGNLTVLEQTEAEKSPEDKC